VAACTVDLEQVGAAPRSATFFIGYDDRIAHIYGRIKPGFAKLRGEPALAGYRLPPSA